MDIQYPVDPDAKGAGTIHYRAAGPAKSTKLAGLFSMSYYCRPTETQFKAADEVHAKPMVYRDGLLQYLRVTEQPEFRGWKLVLYVDEATLAAPLGTEATLGEHLEAQKELWATIMGHPNLILATVHWPEYTMGAGAPAPAQLDNSLLRMFRFRAFQDFPQCPVFVRDADTLFENLLGKGDLAPRLATWEVTLWKELESRAATIGRRFLVASQPHYSRDWHVHPVSGVQTTGCYAGLTCSLGNLDLWTSGALWRHCLAYVRGQSQRVLADGVYKPSDEASPRYIGKDEQLLMYVIVPAMLAHALLQFYYLEYIEVEGAEVEDPAIRALGYTHYPSPYLKLQGREGEPGLHSFKNENEVTETVLLNPAVIPLAMEPRCHDLLVHIFKGDMQRAATAAQRGGRRRRKRTTQRRGRGKRRRRSTSRAPPF
jgi:hypothetical protein